MIQKLIISFAFIITANLSTSQVVCTRTVSDFGATSGDYLVQGTATLQDSAGIFTVILSSDFSTTDGPDLDLYLAISDTSPTNVNNTNVLIGAIASSGAQVLNVPAGVGINDFDFVLIHCAQFDHFWDGGLLGGLQCTTLGIDEIIIDSEIRIYPNPTKNVIHVEAERSIDEIILIDSSGKRLKRSKKTTLNIEKFPIGKYQLIILFKNGEKSIQTIQKL